MNPVDSCQVCTPATSTTAWSAKSCSGSDVCNDGVCQAGCLINGEYYASGMTNPNDVCQTCEPEPDGGTWSNVANGTACSGTLTCQSGFCGTECTIGATTVEPGAVNPMNSCQLCKPEASVTAWSTAADGTSCTGDGVCNAGACSDGCFIMGTYYVVGATSSDGCQSCNPGVSTTGWTDVAPGAPCGVGFVCSAGLCGCYDGAAFHSAADLSTDASNCGACGHSCQGEKCSAGLCAPIVLASGQTSAYGIAVDATNVYWTADTSAGWVAQVSIMGGTPSTIATGQAGPNKIAVVGGNVYWTDSAAGTAGAGSLNATSGPLVTGETFPNGIAANMKSVYWVTSTEMMGYTVSDRAVQMLAAAPHGTGLAIDATNIYWTNNVGTNTGTVLQLPQAGGQVVTLASTQNSPAAMTVSGGMVYWVTNVSGGGVYGVPVGGGTIITLAANQNTPHDVACDGTYVYWLTSLGGAVMRVGLSGGTPTTLATGQGTPVSIAVDANYVYWTNNLAGTVVKLPK